MPIVKRSLCLVTTLLNSLPFSSNLFAKAPPYMLGLIAIASHSSIACEFEKPKSTVKLSETIEIVSSPLTKFIEIIGNSKSDKSTLLFKSVA